MSKDPKVVADEIKKVTKKVIEAIGDDSVSDDEAARLLGLAMIRVIGLMRP